MRELASNVIMEREQQSEKQNEPRWFTDDGMQICRSDEQFRNAPYSIHESRERDSNVTIESDVQREKHIWQSCSTDAGMQTDESDEQCTKA
jgi:hypothetical protein